MEAVQISSAVGIASHKRYTIPRKKRRISEDYQETVSPDSREAKDIENEIRRQTWEATKLLESSYTLTKLSKVQNPDLERDYQIKRAELRDDGRQTKELSESLAFLVEYDILRVNDICQQGLYCDGKNNTLGDGTMGVSLWRCPDICLKDLPCPAESLAVFLLAFKIVKGRVKSVTPQASDDSTPNLEPTPNADCHISKTTANTSSGDTDAIKIATQYYLYEYNDEGYPRDRPRQVLPYAVMHLNRLPAPKPAPLLSPKITELIGAVVKTAEESKPCFVTEREGSIAWQGPVTNKEIGLGFITLMCAHKLGLTMRKSLISIESKLSLSSLMMAIPGDIRTAWDKPLPYRNHMFSLCTIQTSGPNDKFHTFAQALSHAKSAGLSSVNGSTMLFFVPSSDLAVSLGFCGSVEPVRMFCIVRRPLQNSTTPNSSPQETPLCQVNFHTHCRLPELMNIHVEHVETIPVPLMKLSSSRLRRSLSLDHSRPHKRLSNYIGKRRHNDHLAADSFQEVTAKGSPLPSVSSSEEVFGNGNERAANRPHKMHYGYIGKRRHTDNLAVASMKETTTKCSSLSSGQDEEFGDATVRLQAANNPSSSLSPSGSDNAFGGDNASLQGPEDTPCSSSGSEEWIVDARIRSQGAANSSPVRSEREVVNVSASASHDIPSSAENVEYVPTGSTSSVPEVENTSLDSKRPISSQETIKADDNDYLKSESEFKNQCVRPVLKSLEDIVYDSGTKCKGTRPMEKKVHPEKSESSRDIQSMGENTFVRKATSPAKVTKIGFSKLKAALTNVLTSRANSGAKSNNNNTISSSNMEKSATSTPSKSDLGVLDSSKASGNSMGFASSKSSVEKRSDTESGKTVSGSSTSATKSTNFVTFLGSKGVCLALETSVNCCPKTSTADERRYNQISSSCHAVAGTLIEQPPSQESSVVNHVKHKQSDSISGSSWDSKLDTSKERTKAFTRNSIPDSASLVKDSDDNASCNRLKNVTSNPDTEVKVIPTVTTADSSTLAIHSHAENTPAIPRPDDALGSSRGNMLDFLNSVVTLSGRSDQGRSVNQIGPSVFDDTSLGASKEIDPKGDEDDSAASGVPRSTSRSESSDRLSLGEISKKHEMTKGIRESEGRFTENVDFIKDTDDEHRPPSAELGVQKSNTSKRTVDWNNTRQRDLYSRLRNAFKRVFRSKDRPLSSRVVPGTQDRPTNVVVISSDSDTRQDEGDSVPSTSNSDRGPLPCARECRKTCLVKGTPAEIPAKKPRLSVNIECCNLRDAKIDSKGCPKKDGDLSKMEAPNRFATLKRPSSSKLTHKCSARKVASMTTKRQRASKSPGDSPGRNKGEAESSTKEKVVISSEDEIDDTKDKVTHVRGMRQSISSEGSFLNETSAKKNTSEPNKQTRGKTRSSKWSNGLEVLEASLEYAAGEELNGYEIVEKTLEDIEECTGIEVLEKNQVTETQFENGELIVYGMVEDENCVQNEMIVDAVKYFEEDTAIEILEEYVVREVCIEHVKCKVEEIVIESGQNIGVDNGVSECKRDTVQTLDSSKETGICSTRQLADKVQDIAKVGDMTGSTGDIDRQCASKGTDSDNLAVSKTSGVEPSSRQTDHNANHKSIITSAALHQSPPARNPQNRQQGQTVIPSKPRPLMQTSPRRDPNRSMPYPYQNRTPPQAHKLVDCAPRMSPSRTQQLVCNNVVRQCAGSPLRGRREGLLPYPSECARIPSWQSPSRPQWRPPYRRDTSPVSWSYRKPRTVPQEQPIREGSWYYENGGSRWRDG